MFLMLFRSNSARKSHFSEIHGRADGRVDGLTDGKQMDGQTDGPTDGQTAFYGDARKHLKIFEIKKKNPSKLGQSHTERLQRTHKQFMQLIPN